MSIGWLELSYRGCLLAPNIFFNAELDLNSCWEVGALCFIVDLLCFSVMFHIITACHLKNALLTRRSINATNGKQIRAAGTEAEHSPLFWAPLEKSKLSDMVPLLLIRLFDCLTFLILLPPHFLQDTQKGKGVPWAPEPVLPKLFGVTCPLVP